MRYTANDLDENGKPTPRGEILIRGPQVFKGYYKMDELTGETITSDGWLRTGDIAQLIP
jgi:long-chain acyl-CoA synthetase